MTKIINLKRNQKAPAVNQDFLTRRPVELNHTPFSGAIRLLNDDQNRLVSASPNLRNFDYNNDLTKNNISIVEDAVIGFTADGNVTSSNNHLHYSKPKWLVKR